MSINVHLKKSKKYFMVYKEELRWLFSSSYFLFLALIKHLNENLHLLFHFPSAPAPSSSKAAAARFRRRRGTCPPLGESSRLQKDRHSPVYIPINGVGRFTFLHTLSSIYCL